MKWDTSTINNSCLLSDFATSKLTTTTESVWAREITMHIHHCRGQRRLVAPIYLPSCCCIVGLIASTPISVSTVQVRGNSTNSYITDSHRGDSERRDLIRRFWLHIFTWFIYYTIFSQSINQSMKTHLKYLVPSFERITGTQWQRLYIGCKNHST